MLAQYEGFGSVVTCPHGHVHVQIGCTTLTFSEAQHQRFVAMLLESASNSELLRTAETGGFERAGAGPARPEESADWPSIEGA